MYTSGEQVRVQVRVQVHKPEMPIKILIPPPILRLKIAAGLISYQMTKLPKTSIERAQLAAENYLHLDISADNEPSQTALPEGP